MKKILYSILAFVAISFSFTAFTSCEDVPAPFKEPTEKTDTTVVPVADSLGAGTREDPFNVAAAQKYISAHGSEDAEVYVKGKVVYVVKGSFDASYGSLKYYISDDGSETNMFYVFNGYAGANRTKFSGEDALQSGDEVIICGKLVNYNGTQEFTTGNYIVSLNGKDTDGGGSSSEGVATGDGTEANPFNSVAANEYVSTLADNQETDKEFYIKGKIASVKEAYNTQYGNATFYISDDGKADNQFCVYRALYLNNEKYTSGTNIQAGDDVVVCGKLVKYVSSYGTTCETVSGKAYLVSLKSNGSTGGDDDKPVSKALTIDGSTVTLADLTATAGSESIAVDCSTLGYTNQQDVETVTLSDGTVITFDKNGETNGPKYYDLTGGFRVYKNNKITFAGIKKIAKVILTCDSYSGTDYVGNATATVEVSGNNIIYTNVYTESKGGGVQLRIKNIKVVYAK